MTPRRAAAILEAFNRATFDPQTPEILPPETLQVEAVRDERQTPMSILAIIPARDFFAAVGVAATLWFVAAAVCAIFPGA